MFKIIENLTITMVIFRVNGGREYTFIGKGVKCLNDVGNGCREGSLIV